MLSLTKVLILEDQASKLNAAWLTGIDMNPQLRTDKIFHSHLAFIRT